MDKFAILQFQCENVKITTKNWTVILDSITTAGHFKFLSVSSHPLSVDYHKNIMNLNSSEEDQRFK